MTATTHSPASAHAQAPQSTSHAPGPSTVLRILNVVRLQYLNRYTFIYVPVLVLASAVLISLAIYGMINADEPMYGGAAQAPLWYFAAAGVQAMTLTFPFSQALSLTRIEFFLGTALAAVSSALSLALIFVALGYLEQATGGYGINGYIAYMPWLWANGGLSAALMIFAFTLLVFFTGFWCATVYRRGGVMAITLLLVGMGVLLVGVLFVITRMRLWPDVAAFFMTLGPIGAAGIVGLLAVAAGLAGWLTLRKSVP